MHPHKQHIYTFPHVKVHRDTYTNSHEHKTYKYFKVDIKLQNWGIDWSCALNEISRRPILSQGNKKLNFYFKTNGRVC